MALALITEQQDNINQIALDEFIEHRQDLKKPMTKLAIKKARNILARHSKGHQQYMVDRAILSGWTGIWEVEPMKQISSKATTIEQDINDKSWV